MSEPLFSIVILGHRAHHLLPLTLKSIEAQDQKQIEVLLFGEMAVLKKIAGSYPTLSLRLLSSKETTVSGVMNEGIRAASGVYLQFLYPGERFLSQQGLAYLSALIRDAKESDLICSGFLFREIEESPRAVSFPLTQDLLRKGAFPAFFHSIWFSRKELFRLGGFDVSFQYQGTWELICRLFQRKDLKVLYTRRILTDYEPSQIAPKEIARYAVETYRVLYRHFGLWHALKWIFVQDHLRIIHSFVHLFKQAFSKKDSY